MKNKKFIIFGCTLLFFILIAVIIIKSDMKQEVNLTFSDDIAFYINEDIYIPTGEYLIYAASIKQSIESDYGHDIWRENVTLDNGTSINFVEYTKQQIVEQIRMTHLLFLKADEYNITLSEEESKLISLDAEEYYNKISKLNVANIGIDLFTVLKIYEENAIAEKVYNKIINSVPNSNYLDEEEYKHQQLHYLSKIYKDICKELSPKWDYDKYVNDDLLSTISFDKELIKSEDDERKD